MNTTNLFVELIVIGAGAATWVGLLLMSLFGYNWLSLTEITSVIVLIPSISLIYFLGIIVDRLADEIFSKYDKEIRNKYFPDNNIYHEARTYTYTYATDRIINLFEYGKSKMRITRAWSINNLLLAISTSIFVLTRFPSTSLNTRLLITVFATITFAICFLATLIAWKKLTHNDYKRLAETFEFLKYERKKAELKDR